MGRASQIDARYAWLYPLGAVAIMFAMLRSMVVVLAQARRDVAGNALSAAGFAAA